MPIDISSLQESDHGRKVIYKPHPGAKHEEGLITSFNDNLSLLITKTLEEVKLLLLKN